MTQIYRATFTGFTGASYSVDVHGLCLDEVQAICEQHMCIGDVLTVEELT